MSALDLTRLRRLRAVWESAIERDLRLDTRMTLDAVSEARAVYLRELADAAPALLDRLERAERAPAVSRDAGEALYAALEELGVADDLDSAAVERAAVHVERYGERREERGAEGEREQRADHRAADRDVYGAVRR